MLKESDLNVKWKSPELVHFDISLHWIIQSTKSNSSM
jgi:hypothetical protein